MSRYKEAKESAEREELKGNIEKAIDYYLDAVYFLEKDFKNLSRNDERKRQLAVRNLHHKINHLKNPDSELIVETLPKETTTEKLKNNWHLFVIGLVVIILVVIFSNNGNKQPSHEESIEKIKNEQSNSTNTTAASCTYNKMEIKSFEVGTDRLLEEKTINDCFTHITLPNSGGMTEVTNSNNTIRVTYFNNEGSVLRFLNIRFGEQGKVEPARWRTNEGHDIFMNDTGNELNFIFGDRHKTKIKGTIKFTK